MNHSPTRLPSSVEAYSPDGIAKGSEEVLALGPRAALIIALLNLDDTQNELTAPSDQEPLLSIIAIKRRRSTHGGHAWAAPLKLSHDTQAETSKA